MICEVNLAGGALLGLERQRLIGQPFEQYVVPDSRREWSAFAGRVRAKAGGYACEVRLRRQNHGGCDVSIEGAVAAGKAGEDAGCRLAVRERQSK